MLHIVPGTQILNSGSCNFSEYCETTYYLCNIPTILIKWVCFVFLQFKIRNLAIMSVPWLASVKMGIQLEVHVNRIYKIICETLLIWTLKCQGHPTVFCTVRWHQWQQEWHFHWDRNHRVVTGKCYEEAGAEIVNWIVFEHIWLRLPA